VSVTGLANATLYSCSVTATNAIGTSPPSSNVSVTPSANAPIFLVTVQSRKTHTGVGPFDLRIDPTRLIGDAVSVEPRMIGSGHTIVFQFNVRVASLGAVVAIDALGGSIGNASATRLGNDVIVTLTGIPDNRRAMLTLSGVSGPADSTTASTAIGFMVGDVNSSRSVNASDVSSVKAHFGQTTNLSNFWFDLNGSGGIGMPDIAAVKTRSGQVLP